jgi:hypothetical protein
MRTDRKTVMKKLIDAYRKIAKAPKKKSYTSKRASTIFGCVTPLRLDCNLGGCKHV